MGERTKNVGSMLSNPKQRNMYLMICGAAVLTLGVGVYFASQNNTSAVLPAGANVSTVPNVNAVPGSSTSPEYNKQVQKANEDEAKRALNNNASFLPTPTNNSGISDVSPIDLVDKQKAEAKRIKDAQDAADAAELAKIQEEERIKLAQKPPVMVNVNTQPVVQEQVKPVKKPKYSMDDYILISTLSGNITAKAPASEFNFSGEENKGSRNDSARVATDDSTNNSNNQSSAIKPTPLAKAGTIFNAILETAVNSDEPSPVLAKIISGPLAGTRVIGSIKNVGEKVVLQFSVANVPSLPTSTAISAVAVDPDSSRTALASDVDHHYFAKYGVLLASSFLTGWSQALAQNNTTTVVSPLGGATVVPNGNLSSAEINKQALGNVGTELGNSVRQNVQNIKPTVKVDSGIAIGLLLMSDLTIKQ